MKSPKPLSFVALSLCALVATAACVVTAGSREAGEATISGPALPTTQNNNGRSEYTQGAGGTAEQGDGAWVPYDNERMGISFLHPSTWVIQGKDTEATDLSGAPISILCQFVDTVSGTTLSIEYRIGPKGVEHYGYARSQFESSQGWYSTKARTVEVAGQKGLWATLEIAMDGKGHRLERALTKHVVNFLDNGQSGEFELQLQSPTTEELAATLLGSVIGTIKLQP